MDRVRPTAGRVGQRPLLHCTALWLGEDTLVRRPGDTVNFPFTIAVLELEVVLGWSVSWREWNITELWWQAIGKIVALVGDGVADDEAWVRSALLCAAEIVGDCDLRMT